MAGDTGGSRTPEQHVLLEKWLRDELPPEEYGRLHPDIRMRAEEQMRRLAERAEADIKAGRVYPAAEVRQRLLERLREGRGGAADIGA